MLDKLNDNHSFLKSQNTSVGRLNPVNLYSRVNQETMEALNTSKGSINIQKLEKDWLYLYSGNEHLSERWRTRRTS